MNKGGAGGGGGGPTAAAALAAAQKQKTLQQRVDNDIGNIVDNFSFIVNVARVLFPHIILIIIINDLFYFFHLEVQTSLFTVHSTSKVLFYK